MKLLPLLLLIVLHDAARGDSTQCPDGSPPPCIEARRARLASIRRAEAEAPDSATVLVVPLVPVGTDTTVRRLGNDFAAIVAENMTIGEVSARVTPELALVLSEDRAQAAGRRRAGALIDGTMALIAGRVRASMRLIDAVTGRTIGITTLEGSPDSLLPLADRAALQFLSTWWGRQPGARLRAGVSTSSLPALRHFIAAMEAWYRGDPGWQALLDSTTAYDADFLPAWAWLALPADLAQPGRYWDARAAAMDPSVRRLADARRQLVRVDREPFGRSTEAPSRTLLAGISVGRVGTLAPASYPYVCEQQLPARTVEYRYFLAVRGRIATLIGCPDSVARRLAADALAIDSLFVPARALLLANTLDQGDTAFARRLLAGWPRADSLRVPALRRLVQSRFGVPDSQVTTAYRLALWHRLRDALDALPAMQAQLRQRGSGDGAGARALLEVPILYAMGRRREAVVLFEQALGGARSTDPSVALAKQVAFGNLRPDQRFLPASIDSAALAGGLSLVAMAAREQQGVAASDATRLEFGQMVWIAGSLASERGDEPTARLAASALDSLATHDSIRVLPLARALRGELAFRAGDTTAAERLLTGSTAASALHAPARARWLLAQLYANAGRSEETLQLARSITRPNSLQPLDHLGYYAECLVLEGQSFEALGSLAEARRAYREYVELRARADRDLQTEVERIRRRLLDLER